MPRFWLLICGGFVAGILAALGGALALTGNDDTTAPLAALDPVPTIASTLPPSPTPGIELSVTPSPEGTSLRSCEEIRATRSYQDDSERLRFLSECNPAPGPTVTRPTSSEPAAVAPPAVIAAAPPAARDDLSGQIEFIGAVWPDESLPVRYCVNAGEIPVRSNGAKLMSDEAFAGLVRAAFSTWESIPESRIAFSYQGFCASDPMNNRDGVNTVGWGWLFGNAIGLADPSGTHGRFLRQNSTGQLFEVDLVIDIRFAQSFADPTDYLQRQLPHIILHEAGHFLGLGHATAACSVMRPSGIGSGLCSVDIAAAAQLYPR